jgi:hypothetical protein
MASGEKMKIERNHSLRVAFVGWGYPGAIIG